MVQFGIMFHHFYDESRHVRGQGAISAHQLKKLLNAYEGRVLCAKEWQNRLLNNELEDGQTCLTFDDGLLCQYDIALPILEERNLTAFWFPYTAPLDGEPDRLEIYRFFRTVCFEDVEAFYEAFWVFLDQGEFRELINQGLKTFDPKSYLSLYSFYTDGDRTFRYIRDIILGSDKYIDAMDEMMSEYDFDCEKAHSQLWMNDEHLTYLHKHDHVIGLHTHSHPTRITDFPVERQEWEFDKNASWLVDNVGVNANCVAYPCGDYDQRLLDILAERGVQIGFQSRMSEMASHLEVPRIDHIYAIDFVVSSK